MLSETIDPHWIDAFEQVFALCKVRPEETVVLLTETHSRQINLTLSELALARLGAKYYQIRVPSPAPAAGPIIRSSGASRALGGLRGERARRAFGHAAPYCHLQLRGELRLKDRARKLVRGGPAPSGSISATN